MTRSIITSPVVKSVFDVDRVIESFMGDWLPAPSVLNDRNVLPLPAVDIEETDDTLTLVAELPGMKRDDIQVVVHEGVLTISGQRESKIEEEGDRYSRREIVRGAFKRAFTLPKTVEVEKIDAQYEDGLLKITFPKIEEAKPKRIEVKVK